jgi:hypothetical protein
MPPPRAPAVRAVLTAAVLPAALSNRAVVPAAVLRAVVPAAVLRAVLPVAVLRAVLPVAVLRAVVPAAVAARLPRTLFRRGVMACLKVIVLMLATMRIVMVIQAIIASGFIREAESVLETILGLRLAEA